MVIDEVAEHVQVLLVAVDRGDLDGRNEADAQFRAGVQRLRDAVDGVVVAQREQLDARFRRGRDHPVRLEGSVRVERVALEVEGGPIGAQAPRA